MTKPTIKERVSKLEEWRQHHPDIHRLENVARQIAAKDIDRRLEAMNELRRQIEEERGVYLTRDLYDREHGTLSGRVRDLELNRGEDKLTPFIGGLRYLGYIAAVVLGAIMTWWLRGH